jgi:hypothetical protein
MSEPRSARRSKSGHCSLGFADPQAAARKLIEIANATEADQAGRLQVGDINLAFIRAGGTPVEYVAVLETSIALGRLTKHRSGAFLTFTQAGADLFA